MFHSSRLCAVALTSLVALAAAPGFAQDAEESQASKETCLEVSVDGGFKLKIPCPPGLRPLLEQLPRPAEPAPRRDFVIDPEWPHDQAMIEDHDWPYDHAMIIPRAGEGEEAIPLFGDLLGLFERRLSDYSADRPPGNWYFEMDDRHIRTDE